MRTGGKSVYECYFFYFMVQDESEVYFNNIETRVRFFVSFRDLLGHIAVEGGNAFLHNQSAKL